MATMIVGIAGKKGVGKDTLAGITQFKRVAFADSLKKFCAAHFGVDPDGHKEALTHIRWRDFQDVQIPSTQTHPTHMTRREVWQTVGTDVMVRHVPDFWIRVAVRAIDALRAADYDVVVPDVRFPAEAQAITRLGGFIVDVRRDLPGKDEHASEAGLPDELIDYYIDNSGTLDDLTERWCVIEYQIRQRGDW